LLEDGVVAPELDEEPKELGRLWQMGDKSSVQIRVGVVFGVAALDGQAVDAASELNVPVHVGVVGAEIDRPVARPLDSAADVLRDNDERMLRVVEASGTRQIGDPSTDDDHFL
jgi:hypothetical protein